MMIKVCGITRREDALAAVDAGASALGFIFYSASPRYVAPEKAAELGDGLPVWKVGVFVDETTASIERAIRAANLDVIQIYGGEAPSDRRVWKAFRVTLPDGRGSERLTEPRASASGMIVGPLGPLRSLTLAVHSLPSANGDCEAVLLDGARSGATFDWRLARGAAEKVIIAGGLDATNVGEAIRLAAPWGVDASSRLESAPGIKDHDKVRQFIKAARETS